MNLLHLKYALEVAKSGSLSKASETLIIAVPNISRSIKELEADLGITIFERTKKGMQLTHDGEELIGFAKSILVQIDQLEGFYKKGTPKKKKFSISVPRASYISDAFTNFTNSINLESMELFYKETNSDNTIKNILSNDYNLGIIRYSANYDKHFKVMLEEKNLCGELITEFTYSLIMSENSPLASKDDISYEDLTEFTEIAHADPYVPSIAPSKVFKEELPSNINKRIFIFERGSQFELLSKNANTFMWVSPVPTHLLEKHGLVQKKCTENKRLYRDVLIYKEGYSLTMLDRTFITQLCESKRKYFK